MADNFPLTPGFGRNAATDQVTYSGDTADVQLVRLVTVTGSEGSKTVTEMVRSDTQRTTAHRDVLRVQVTSAGLTTATTSYTAGDQVGNLFTIANAARATGGTGRIVGVTLLDDADIIGPYDVVFFRSSVTLASDNAAFAISDADAAEIIAVVPLSGAWDLGNNRIGQAHSISIPYDCSGGTSLYASLITRAAHTFFSATDDLTLQVFVERD